MGDILNKGLNQLIKWAEIAGKSSLNRYQILSEFLSQQGVENSLEFIEVSPGDFQEVFLSSIEKFEVLRIGSPFLGSSAALVDGQNTRIRNLSTADTFLKRGSQKVLKSFLYESLHLILMRNSQFFKPEDPALVVGAGAAAKTACGVLVQVGYKEILITNQYAEEAQNLIEDLKKIFFHVKFDFVQPEKLVNLSGNQSILINTTPVVKENTLLEELYYYNFLRADGMVIDLYFTKDVTPLVQEARQIGIRFVQGFETALLTDYLFAKEIFGLKATQEEYEKFFDYQWSLCQKESND